MPRESFYPYPPRPGIGHNDFDDSEISVAETLSPEASQSVIEFEHQLYHAQLDPALFTSADAYKQQQTANGLSLQPLELVWQKKVNSYTFGLSYFVTPEGQQALQTLTGHELQAQTIEDIQRELSCLDISEITSDKLGKLEDQSVEHEEELLTKAFIDSDFDGDKVADPHFFEIYKNPEAILEKAKDYRQLKIYIGKALTDLQSGVAETDPDIAKTKILLAKLYRQRLNDFIADIYIDAYKFAFQAVQSNQEKHQALLTKLETTLPAFRIPVDANQVGRFLVRIDRYCHGVSLGDNGKFTWLSHEAQSQANLADQEIDSVSVDRNVYTDIEPDELSSTEIEGSTFGELLQGVLKEYDLLSEYSEWDSERQTPAPDGKWQVIVDGRFKSLAVDKKQRIVKVPTKKDTLLRVVSVGNHELTHVIQHHNERLIGNLAILDRIGLDNVTEQTESGGKWQEKVAREILTGIEDNDVSGTGYLKTLNAKAEGAPFGKGVKLYYEDLMRRNPSMSHEKAAAQAVNRARRAYRSGGFEYAKNLPLLTNSQPLNYLEQELIYKNLSPEQRRLLFIGGISIANMVQLSRIGFIDLSQIFIPNIMPWELMYPKIKELVS